MNTNFIRLVSRPAGSSAASAFRRIDGRDALIRPPNHINKRTQVSLNGGAEDERQGFNNLHLCRIFRYKRFCVLCIEICTPSLFSPSPLCSANLKIQQEQNLSYQNILHTANM